MTIKPTVYIKSKYKLRDGWIDRPRVQLWLPLTAWNDGVQVANNILSYLIDQNVKIIFSGNM